MEELDSRLRSALASQLVGWREALDAGAARIGWKLGMGDAESIGGEIAVGHLTSRSVLVPGSIFVSEGSLSLHADAEVAVTIARDVPPDADEATVRASIAGYGVALEIVDLANAGRGPQAVVASNVFHRAVAFGDSWAETPPAQGAEGRLLVNGTVRANAPVPADVPARVRAAARVLGSVGERLRAGDRLITGSIVQVEIAPGDDVIADIDLLGSAAASIRRSGADPGFAR